MAEVGRPPILDETAKQQIVALVSAGSSLRVAARYLCCDEGTIRNALMRDAEFAASVDRARCTAEFALLPTIRNASKHSRYAAAWLLEHTLPERC